jgi:hypothetical protein
MLGLWGFDWGSSCWRFCEVKEGWDWGKKFLKKLIFF